MGPVSALRGTSVVFAALIDRFFLHERLTAYRIAACIVIAIGALCFGHNGGAGNVLGVPPAPPVSRARPYS